MEKSYLSLVKEEVSKVVEVISAALKVETEIVDEHMMVLGATSYNIQNFYYDPTEENSCITREVIMTKKPLVLTDPKENSLCAPCSEKKQCFYSAGIYFPIMLGEKCCGVLSLVAFNDEQRIIILENRNTFLKFGAQMAELLVVAIREQLLLLETDTPYTIMETTSKFEPRELLDRTNNYPTFDDIIGESDNIKIVKNMAYEVKDSPSTVFLTGESGSGKELFAKAIHYSSHRKTQPYIAINCAAIPENLLESELFGYEDGAFTGAKRGGKTGLFEAAKGGTFFLDEIGDMPLTLQSKLLRVLQEKTFQRVGGINTIPINCRIIVATHENLSEKISQGLFRQDLFYRINVIPINIPPLRQRKADLPFLVEYLTDKYCKQLGKEKMFSTKSFMKKVYEYQWPGNVRELENAIEYAVNFSYDNKALSGTMLPSWINLVTNDRDHEEKEKITELIEQYGNSVAGKKKVALDLGIDISTLYRKIKKLNI
ncbi:MAG: sigma 54-interacting transcriptional regulator [Anaerovoracaceae bacterium]